LVNVRHLEHDAARLNHANPVIDRTLALTHTGFGGLGGHRLIPEDAKPHAATALGVAGDGAAGSFDLALRDPGRFKGLQRIFAKLNVSAARGLAGHAPAHLFTVFNPFWHQHSDLSCDTARLLATIGDYCRLLAHVNVGWLRRFFFLQLFARVNPDLDADAPECRQRFRSAKVDYGAQRIARDATFDLPLTTGHFGPG